MRKIKQILQLHYESGLSRRTIAATAGTSYGSVANYLNRAEKAGISWPLPDNMDERDLGRLLFPSQKAKGKRRFTDPDFPSDTGRPQVKNHHEVIALRRLPTGTS